MAVRYLMVMLWGCSLAAMPFDFRGNVVSEGDIPPISAIGAENEVVSKSPPESSMTVRRSQALYEQALAALRASRRPEALRLLEEAAQDGRDEAARRSTMLLIRERASEGPINLDTYTGSLSPEDRGRALLAAADGYRLCQFRRPDDQRCRESERQVLFEASAGELTAEMLQARLRLAGIFLEEHRFSQARDILLPLFETPPEKKVPWDRAWFYLARSLEGDAAQRDPYRAAQAYAKVLEFDNSAYAAMARSGIKRLRRFYLGEP